MLDYLLEDLGHCGLNVWRDHLVIGQFTRPLQDLRFGAAPVNPHQVVGELWAAHREAVDDWIAFERFFDQSLPLAQLLASGSGLLATGPDFLIPVYELVLNAHNCLPVSQTLPTPPRAKGAVMVHFGGSHVVAEGIAARRIG